MPIGNLTSQHFANFYLSAVDHLAKDRLRIRPYLRYMDDLLLFGNDPAELLAQGQALEDRCHRLHPYRVRPRKEDLIFLLFRMLPTHVRVKKETANRARARLEKLATAFHDAPNREAKLTAYAALMRSLQATFAHWSYADSYRLRQQVLWDLGLHPAADEPDGTESTEQHSMIKGEGG